MICATVGIFFRLIFFLFFFFVKNKFIRISKYCISICIQPILLHFICFAVRIATSLQSVDLNIGCMRISRRRKLDSLTVKSDNSIFFRCSLHFSWCQVSHLPFTLLKTYIFFVRRHRLRCRRSVRDSSDRHWHTYMYTN